jgi:hypothetical protein
MPAWMHERAEHILAKNPSMPKSEAFAIATQQMHSLGKGPKSYGTAEGKRTAKAKYDTPKDDKKTANPGNLKSEKMEKKAMNRVSVEAFFDELEQIKLAQAKEAGMLDALSKGREGLSNLLGRGGKFVSGGGGKASAEFTNWQKGQAAKPVARAAAPAAAPARAAAPAPKPAAMPANMHGFSDPAQAKAYAEFQAKKQQAAAPGPTPTHIGGQSLLGGMPRASQVVGLPPGRPASMPPAAADQSGVRLRPQVQGPAMQGAA